jgi:hypothetical protein
MSRDVHLSNTVITTAPASSSTVVLWDSTADPALGTTLARKRSFSRIRRAVVRIYADQIVTFKFSDRTAAASSWRIVNGAGAGEATTANTWFERDCLFTSDDHKLEITIGAVTQITVWEVSVRLVEEDRGLGQ